MCPLVSAAGRALTGAILMASVLRDRQVIGLHFKGDGALGSVYAEASYEGESRGWCDRPEADLPLKDGGFDIAGGVGLGFLYVTRSQPFEKAPHVSTVQLVSGEIGEDLAFYLHQSLQIPSVIALGAATDAHGKLEASGGVVLELMPGAPESVIAHLEKQVAAARPLSALLKEGAGASALLHNFTGLIRMNSIPHEHVIRYTCRCSIDRVERSLTLVGPDSLKELIADPYDAEVRCEFCGRSYTVTRTRLQEMVNEMSVRH
ncbi:MAG: Hsp33 family molecular chaperone HslO [Proteobacteria bacterium]|nr:Hsp33 family molecular chaperone HslO [Pseudomonadota bacterium]